MYGNPSFGWIPPCSTWHPLHSTIYATKRKQTPRTYGGTGLSASEPFGEEGGQIISWRLLDFYATTNISAIHFGSAVETKLRRYQD